MNKCKNCGSKNIVITKHVNDKFKFEKVLCKDCKKSFTKNVKVWEV